MGLSRTARAGRNVDTSSPADGGVGLAIGQRFERYKLEIWLPKHMRWLYSRNTASAHFGGFSTRGGAKKRQKSTEVFEKRDWSVYSR